MSVRLHHVHASPQASRVEFEHPAPMTWRADGNAKLALKHNVARRLAVCWNVLEGIPTAALEGGILSEVFAAIDSGDIERARRAVSAIDAELDVTADGALHDCESCKRSA